MKMTLWFIHILMQSTSPQQPNALEVGAGELSGVVNISCVWFALSSSHKRENLCSFNLFALWLLLFCLFVLYHSPL